MLKTIFVTALIAGTIAWMLEDCSNANAQQRQNRPIQPGQDTPCWEVVGTTYPTHQCADGRWQVTVPDGTFLVGAGPLPAEYQPLPAEIQGPPPMSQFAPGVLFGSGIPSGRQ